MIRHMWWYLLSSWKVWRMIYVYESGIQYIYSDPCHCLNWNMCSICYWLGRCTDIYVKARTSTRKSQRIWKCWTRHSPVWPCMWVYPMNPHYKFKTNAYNPFWGQPCSTQENEFELVVPKWSRETIRQPNNQLHTRCTSEEFFLWS